MRVHALRRRSRLSSRAAPEGQKRRAGPKVDEVTQAAAPLRWDSQLHGEVEWFLRRLVMVMQAALGCERVKLLESMVVRVASRLSLKPRSPLNASRQHVWQSSPKSGKG
jgi:hypothetical protein